MFLTYTNIIRVLIAHDYTLVLPFIYLFIYLLCS